MHNEIFEFKTETLLDSDESQITSIIENFCPNVEKVYSYFVGCKDTRAVIKINVACIDSYNTLDCEDVKNDIIKSIVSRKTMSKSAKCMTFGLPPLDLIIELYKPALSKMVEKIHNQWRSFEKEDLMSMANLVVVKLYNEGYYLNKYIIWTSLNNEILIECRKLRLKPNVVSLDTAFNESSKFDDEKLTYGDIIEDDSYNKEREEEDENALENFTFEQVKSIIIEKIGERQWDRLWRDYKNQHTTNASRVCMKKLKSYFAQLGLTRQDFINHYRR